MAIKQPKFNPPAPGKAKGTPAPVAKATPAVAASASRPPRPRAAPATPPITTTKTITTTRASAAPATAPAKKRPARKTKPAASTAAASTTASTGGGTPPSGGTPPPPASPGWWDKFKDWVKSNVTGKWIFRILLALVAVFLVWKYWPVIDDWNSRHGIFAQSKPSQSTGPAIGGGPSYRQIPITEADGATDSETNSLKTIGDSMTPTSVEMKSSKGGTVVQSVINVINSTNVTIGDIGGYPMDNIRQRPAPRNQLPPQVPPQQVIPPPPPKPLVFPGDFTPDHEATVFPDCCGVTVKIPPGKYHKYHLAETQGWDINPTVKGPPLDKVEIEVNGKLLADKSPRNRIPGIKHYGFRNTGDVDLEVTFNFHKRPGWLARQFGAK